MAYESEHHRQRRKDNAIPREIVGSTFDMEHVCTYIVGISKRGPQAALHECVEQKKTTPQSFLLRVTVVASQLGIIQI